MIYLVSNRLDCSKWEGIEPMSVEDSVALISSWPVVQTDTETPGLDPRVVKKCWSFQFGYKDFKTGKSDQVVVDLESVDAQAYKSIWENSNLILQNAKFDIKFAFNYGFVPRRIYDTMIIEQLLYLGYTKKQISFNLHDILYRHTGIELDKSYQKFIAYKGINSEEAVRYAAMDVMYLQDIRRSQVLLGQSRECLKAFTVENRFVPAIAYLEWCGIHLDQDKWKKRMAINEAGLKRTYDNLNNYVLSNPNLSEFVSTSMAAAGDSDDTAGLFTFEPMCYVDWNSPQQVAPIFKKLGFDISVFDKDLGEEKDSIAEKVLQFQTGIDDFFLNTYLDYKGYYKSVSSYGQGHLNQINPYTDRIHTEFRQIGTVTGRMASGSKQANKDLARIKGLRADLVTYCNMQNLPARGDDGKVVRSCFTATPGNVFISCDYSAEESRVQADVWNEESLLDAFEKGIDTHNLYAKLCFPEDLKDVDVKDVKDVRPDLRQAAKSVEFSVGYGSDGSSMAAALGKPKDECRKIVKDLLAGMPGMANFKKNAVKFLKNHGYLVINEITRHRVYWPEWARWKAVEDSFDRDFWLDYNAYHKGTGDEVCEKVRKHKAESHDWFEKNVLNYPIQGGSAVVLKQAAADLFDWVVNNGFFNKILFCVFVHDEIDVECPVEYADTFKKVMQYIMQHAASMYYHRLAIPAEASEGDHWIH